MNVCKIYFRVVKREVSLVENSQPPYAPPTPTPPKEKNLNNNDNDPPFPHLKTCPHPSLRALREELENFSELWQDFIFFLSFSFLFFRRSSIILEIQI